MKNARMFVLAFAAGCVGVSAASFAAQQLASGARTSCKVNSVIPAQRAIQMAADPLGVWEFQFSMAFDATRLDVISVAGMNGYQVGVRGAANAPSFFIDDKGVNSTISVRGFWPETILSVPTIELDVYLVNFQEKAGVPTPDSHVYTFECLGLSYTPPWQNDNFVGVDTDLAGEPNPFFTTPFTLIRPSGPTLFSFSGVVPEPGFLGLFTLAALPLARRKR